MTELRREIEVSLTPKLGYQSNRLGGQTSGEEPGAQTTTNQAGENPKSGKKSSGKGRSRSDGKCCLVGGYCPSALGFHQEHLPTKEAMPRSSWDSSEV